MTLPTQNNKIDNFSYNVVNFKTKILTETIAESGDDDSIVCGNCCTVQLSFMAAISLLQPHRTILVWISLDIS